MKKVTAYLIEKLSEIDISEIDPSEDETILSTMGYLECMMKHEIEDEEKIVEAIEMLISFSDYIREPEKESDEDL